MSSFVIFLSLAAAPQQVTFEAARELAQQQAPEITLAQHRAAFSKAEISVAGALANPTLSVSSASQAARLGTALSVPLPLFGQRGTAISAAEADANVAMLEVEVARREARRAATLAWVELWEAQQRSHLLALASSDAIRVFSVATEKFDAGIGAKVDLLRTRADSARAAAEAEAGTHDVSAASARLAVALGVETRLIASGAPAYPELPASLTLLLSDHPSLQRDREAVSAAQAHVVAERRQRWPVVNAQLGLNQFDPAYAGQEFVVGLSFDLPVLSLRGGAIARARAQQVIAEATLTLEEQRLRSQANEAWGRALSSAAQRQALKNHVLPDLEETRSLTEEGYGLGRLELLRVLEAQKALLEARLAEVQAFAAWTRAVADLEWNSNLTLVTGAADVP